MTKLPACPKLYPLFVMFFKSKFAIRERCTKPHSIGMSKLLRKLHSNAESNALFWRVFLSAFEKEPHSQLPFLHAAWPSRTSFALDTVSQDCNGPCHNRH